MMHGAKTMKIIVKLLGTLRKYSDSDSPGRLQVDLPSGSTVTDLIDRITDRRGEAAACAINGHTRRLDTVIDDGDEVVLLSTLGGG